MYIYRWILIIIIFSFPDISLYINKKKQFLKEMYYYRTICGYWILELGKILFIGGCIAEYGRLLTRIYIIISLGIYAFLCYKVIRKKLKTQDTLLFAFILDGINILAALLDIFIWYSM